MTWGILWFVAQALLPVDHRRGHRPAASSRRTAGRCWPGPRSVLGLAVTISFCGVMRHRAAVANWLQAAFRMIQLLGDHAAGTGAAPPQQVPTGEVVATVASDAQRVGGMYDVLARFAGASSRTSSSPSSCCEISVPLGLLVLIGVPIVTAALGGLIAPLAPPAGRPSASRSAG